MALLDFQTALGRIVRAPKGAAPIHSLDLDESEISCLETLRASAGYRLTVEVQHSWCVGRAARSVSFTLSILHEDLRRQLLDDWTDAGGGTTSFFSAEGEALLEFIAGRLPDPSHELTACRFEQATMRAHERAIGFTPPDPNLLSTPGCRLRRGLHAGKTEFHGEPYVIIAGLTNHETLPLDLANATTMLFGPGLENLCRVASCREAALWEKLTAPVAVTGLSREGYNPDDLIPMLEAGILEFAVCNAAVEAAGAFEVNNLDAARRACVPFNFPRTSRHDPQR